MSTLLVVFKAFLFFWRVSALWLVAQGTPQLGSCHHGSQTQAGGGALTGVTVSLHGVCMVSLAEWPAAGTLSRLFLCFSLKNKGLDSPFPLWGSNESSPWDGSAFPALWDREWPCHSRTHWTEQVQPRQLRLCNGMSSYLEALPVPFCPFPFWV